LHDIENGKYIYTIIQSLPMLLDIKKLVDVS